MNRRRSKARRLRRVARAARPPDPAAIRRRQEALEAELDNQEQARRRAAADADLAAAMAPAPATQAARVSSTALAELARILAAHPILTLPVHKVVTATPLAVLVRAWDLEVWVPKSAIHHDDPDSLLDGWSGTLEISTRWAMSVGLPPLPKAPACAGRSTT